MQQRKVFMSQLFTVRFAKEIPVGDSTVLKSLRSEVFGSNLDGNIWKCVGTIFLPQQCVFKVMRIFVI